MEQRSSARKALECAGSIVEAASAATTPIRVLDVSKTGLAFSTGQRLIVNTTLTIGLELPGHPAPLRFLAKIVNRTVHADGFRVGASIVKLDPDDAAVLARYVDAD